jgi:hypothetical protein
MSLEALWSLAFESDVRVEGDGIVIFEAGRIFGGNSAMIYTGEYSIRENEVRARAHVERYASPPGIVSVFALNEFTLRVNGQYDEKCMTLRGLIAEDPRRAIWMKLVRRAELPQWQSGHMLQSEAIR